MCGPARLDLTCDHLTPIFDDVRTFISDRRWPKIGSKRFLKVSVGLSQIVCNWIGPNCIELSSSMELSNQSI